MAKQNVSVALYKSHNEAESAIKELQKAGLNMKNLSIVGIRKCVVTGLFNVKLLFVNSGLGLS